MICDLSKVKFRKKAEDIFDFTVRYNDVVEERSDEVKRPQLIDPKSLTKNNNDKRRNDVTDSWIIFLR